MPPVSYTHLDVYKRQDIWNAAFTGLKNVIISVNAEYKDYFTASLTALDTSAIITSEAAIQSGGYDVDISYEMIKIGDYEYFCEIGKRNNESVTFIMRRDARDTEEILFEITGQYRFDYIADTYEGSDYQYLYFTARDMSKIYSHSEISVSYTHLDVYKRQIFLRLGGL